jgi:DNA-binding NarL/FixJ family response regulator
VAAIRAAVVTMSPMIFDIITTLLSARATLNVVAEFDSRAEIQAQLGGVALDLILIGLEAGENDDIARTLLAIIPRARVIAFSSDGRNAYVHEMRPFRRELLDVSPRVLTDAILRKTRHPKI